MKVANVNTFFINLLLLCSRTYALRRTVLDCGRFLAGCTREKSVNCIISILDFGLAILDCESQNLQGFRRLNL